MLDAFIKGHSDAEFLSQAIKEFCATDLRSPSKHWFTRVPSASNPADEPSRGLVGTLKGRLSASRVNPSVALRKVWSLAGVGSAVLK